MWRLNSPFQNTISVFRDIRNFYLANKGIVMPAFGHETYDKAAYDLFIKLFPQHKISQIDAIDVFAGGGGIHCITQQQPVARK